ncbi:hypothetical protein WJX77_000605 [Trebouxia sp. C0004]
MQGFIHGRASGDAETYAAQPKSKEAAARTALAEESMAEEVSGKLARMEFFIQQLHVDLARRDSIIQDLWAAHDGQAALPRQQAPFAEEISRDNA